MNRNKFKLDFIVIGVARSATTWMWECLRNHSQVCIPPSKRIPFWNEEKYYSKGIDYYRGYFNKCSQEKIKGHVHDSYYLFPKVAKRIKKHFPDIKIIISLRNPIDALQSLYCHQKAFGHKKFKNFKEAIQDKKFCERGFYYKSLVEWLRFFPRD
jgi:hypothetical protein